jgi:rubrerythrin
MAGVTVGALLNRARRFEIRLEQFYRRVRDKSADNSVRLLTYYLARHRQHQELALQGLDPRLRERLRKTQLDESVDFTSFERFPLLGKAPEKTAGPDLLEAAIRYDEALVDLYRRLLNYPLDDEARAAIEAMIRIEERDMVMLKKMLAMRYF